VESDITATARVTAAWRARETARADPLFHDPWAAALAGPESIATLTAQPSDQQERASSYTIVRTRVFDDWLLSRTDCRQIVLLGAGFDTRAFRLSWPIGTQIWELDQAQVFAAKEAALAAVPTDSGCAHRHTVVADLASDRWPALLAAADFRWSTAKYWEG